MKIYLNVISFFALVLVFANSMAQSNSVVSGNVDEVARKIPYQSGKKNAQILAAERALDEHPMLSSALRGVVESNDHCVLDQFYLEKRPKEDLLSTQFNGGELNVVFIYFCFLHTKAEIREGLKNEANWKGEGPADMADVVLTVRGNFSEGTRKIIDPSISYSYCYSHFCGSI